ncbi:unnamed protein product, partial [Closterium sp. NIES-54]
WIKEESGGLVRQQGCNTSPRLSLPHKSFLSVNPPNACQLVYTLLRLFGSKRRVADLYGSRDLLNMVARNVKRGLTGVENVYTQHQPLIAQIIDAATKGRLSEADYPFISGNFQQSRWGGMEGGGRVWKGVEGGGMGWSAVKGLL